MGWWLVKEHWERAENFSNKERGKGRETEVINNSALNYKGWIS